MDHKIKKILFILISVSIIVGLIFNNCKITFITKNPAEIVGLLMSFSVIAILIERFTNGVIIKPDNLARNRSLIKMNKLKMDSLVYETRDRNFNLANNDIPVLKSQIDLMQNEVDREQDKVEKHAEKFNWVSFGLGLLISALGFRFFDGITDSGACESKKEFLEIAYTYLFPLLDVFLTGILLSSGSKFIDMIKNIFTTS